MHYFSYNENKEHGTLNFPVAYYLVDSSFARAGKTCEVVYLTKGDDNCDTRSKARDYGCRDKGNQSAKLEYTAYEQYNAR